METAQHLEAKEAELSVLGGILLDNTALDRVLPQLAAEDFHVARHAVIYRAMRHLADQAEPIDPVTLVQHLEQAQRLEAVGGLNFVLALSEASATAVNIEHHAGIVRDAADVRRLVSTCRDITQRATSGDYDDSASLFDHAQQAVFEVGSQKTGQSFTAVKTALRDAVEKAQRAYETKSVVTGTPSGFTDLDGKTAGLHPGSLIILAARPAMGKTALALNIACNAARLSGGTTAVFSLEMPTTELAGRMLASEARVNGERMRTGHLADEDIDRLLQAVKGMNDQSIFIDDTAASSVMEIRSKCRRLAADKSVPPLKLVVIDYLQLMHGAAGPRSREQEVSDISRNLKALAKELDVPVLALSQLNRGVESRPNKRPQLSDLRESGAIEQDADIVMFVYRDEYYHEDTEDRGIAEIIVGKHRAGSTGTIKLRFFKEWTRFDNLKRAS